MGQHAEDRPVEGRGVVLFALADQVGEGERPALDLVVTPAVVEAAGHGLKPPGLRVSADLLHLPLRQAVGVDQQAFVLPDIVILAFFPVVLHRPQDGRIADDLRLQVREGLHQALCILIPDQGAAEPPQLLDLVGKIPEGLRRRVPDTGRVGNRRDLPLPPEDRRGENGIVDIPDFIAAQDHEVRVRQVLRHMKDLLGPAEKVIFSLSELIVAPVDAGHQLFLFGNRISVKIQGLDVIGGPGRDMGHPVAQAQQILLQAVGLEEGAVIGGIIGSCNCNIHTTSFSKCSGLTPSFRSKAGRKPARVSPVRSQAPGPPHGTGTAPSQLTGIATPLRNHQSGA